MMSYRNLDDFLSKHKFVKGEQGTTPTHTRIGDKVLNILGGSYYIPNEEKDVFYELYYKKVFQEKKPEYLTEKQSDNGPILIDFDLKFSVDVDIRLYTNDHLMDILNLYLDTLKNMIQFTSEPFPVFIMEKNDVNRCVEKGLTKDGIHIIIGVQMDHTLQVILRKRILEEIPHLWEEGGETPPLPITNTWENVVDDTICKGTTNWQLFGSRKPAHQAYGLTKYYIVTFDESDSGFSFDEKSTKVEKELLAVISAQNNSHPLFNMKKELEEEYNQAKTKPVKTKRKSVIKFNIISDDPPALEDIKNREQLEVAVNTMLKSFGVTEYELHEIHDYTQILPESYYEDGSHLKNQQVAFALKDTDDRLFLSWVMLRSKSLSFDYSEIPNLFHRWNTYFNKNGNRVTKSSIIYWAKHDAPPEKFLEVRSSSLNHYIDETLTTSSATDYDIAKVLLHMNKDMYCCVNIGMKTWFAFENHRWVEDKSMIIRNKISEEVHRLYNEKTHNLMKDLSDCDVEDEKRHTFLTEQLKKTARTCEKLKKTSDKNNIFREAMEIFYDGKFLRKTDSNKNLVCFNNGVVDIETKTFRPGMPTDYITKCTNNDYIENIGEYIAATETGETEGLDGEILTFVNEIYEYMKQLYPTPNLCEYMWKHLASCLIGENINQTCSFYIGSGSNGKSCIVELMSYAFGDYKGVLPISVVTEKRAGVGGTTSELIALKGVRYAVMQESSKGMRINEGILKELTGGDTIVGRQLFKESEMFTPQFTLVVCTNNLPDVDANDDGTWRRIKTVPHLAKFVDDLEDERYSSCPYKFKKDKNVKDKLKKWAPIFMSMLVHKVFQTGGNVLDCEEVLRDSTKYRESQDYMSRFMKEMIVSESGKYIKKQELLEHFKAWFQVNQAGTGTKMPKVAEIHAVVSLKYGEPKRIEEIKKEGWVNVRINYDERDDAKEI